MNNNYNYSTSALGCEMVDSQRGARRRVGYNHPISNKACEITFLLKPSTKYRQFSPILFVNTPDFQFAFNFEQT